MNTKLFNKLTTLVAICMMLLVSSCKKYLDQQPITEVGPAFVFSDVSHVQQALASVYSRLVGDQGYGIRLSLYYPLDNDAMQGPTGAADNDRRDIARYSATPGNAQLLKPFNQLFQGIEYANICIANIPKMDMYSKGSDQQKKQLQRMYGEALTLRAQFYLEAIRNWGDLPAQFQPAAVLALSNPLPGRTDRDSLYNQLLADLKNAEGLVPWRNEVSGIGDPNDERITKGAVKGLRARIALYRGGYSLRQDGTMKRSADYKAYYQIARDECNDIITSGQHALNSSFKSLWKDQVCAHAVNDPAGELMFQTSAIGQSGAEDTKLGYYNGPRVNNKGNSSVNPLATYFYLFDSTDQRRDVTVCHYFTNLNGTRAGQAITNMTDGKYRRDWITNPTISPTNAVQYFSLKWQILRYSDVLLMFAEAENEVNNGPTAAAYNAINMVRRRGYGKPISAPDASVDIPSGLSQSDFFKYIVRERALEFGGEGIRKYDLIRWNLLATAISETRANLVKMSTNTALADPSYMAGYPVYSKVTTLPASMYIITGTTSDDNNIGGLWYNSLYKSAPSSTPSGTTKVTWIGSAINTTSAARFATGFVTGKGELLPIPQGARDADFNLTQNPNY
ncbi:MAG TPA: RagB/SusD family nutrient uptake outer membrane protein [Chitinophagaceae bacterium]|nr:RagB/SusD family nutrient uptake outer membrane protein [Chitinophagaceae bacterium]